MHTKYQIPWKYGLECVLLTILLIQNAMAKPYNPSIWRGSISQSTYYYSDYKIPQAALQKRKFTPTPPNCPETGRTVCKEVERYPSEEMFDLVKSSKSKRFNFTSIFMDESLNDLEPKLEEPTKESIEPQHKGYIIYQTSLHYNIPQPSFYPNFHYPLNYQSIPFPSSLINNVPDRSTYTISDTQQTEASLKTSLPSSIFKRSNPWKPILSETVVNRTTKRTRNKRQTDLEEICKTQTMFITPKAALNDRSEWKFIVNLGDKDPRLKQVIKVNICSKPNNSCSNQISLPFGYKSKCKQKYIKKKLLSLDPNGQGTSSENFFVPSCCACEIIRDKL